MPANIRRFSPLAVFLTAALLAACASTGRAPAPRSADTTLYRLAEPAAFGLAHAVLRTTFPDRDIHSLNGDVKGYFVQRDVVPDTDVRYARFVEQTVAYRIEVIPSQGLDATGKPVSGFTFRVNVIGTDKKDLAFKQTLTTSLQAALDKTGASVTVSDVSPGKYMARDADVPRYVEPPSDQAPAAPAPAAPADDVFKKLQKLKALYDKGVITREDFERKKQELLKRI